MNLIYMINPNENNMYNTCSRRFKGIKDKNLRKLNQKPLIYYPIKAALKSKVCDEIFVSTDSIKIANVAKKYGASVPFLRNKKFSKSLTSTEATLRHSLLEFEKI